MFMCMYVHGADVHVCRCFIVITDTSRVGVFKQKWLNTMVLEFNMARNSMRTV